jgi:hypothetical protein
VAVVVAAAQVPAVVAVAVALLRRALRLLVQASLTPLRLVVVALVVQQHYKAQTEHLANLAGCWPCLAAVVVVVQTRVPLQ